MLKKLIFGLSMAVGALTINAQSIAVPEQLQGKTITVIIPYAPGGDTDNTQRFMGEQAKKLTGLNFVYVNKAGRAVHARQTQRPPMGCLIYL